MPKGSGNRRLEVVGYLESAVLSGKLKPGTHLPEVRLARELGVSQAIVREALQELEGRGLILKQANLGSRVVELTSDDLKAIYQVRRELEPLAFMLAAQQMNEKVYSTLEGCVIGMEAAGRLGDFLEFARCDILFHRSVWASQPNRYLERCLVTVCMPLFVYDLITRASTTAIDYARVGQQHRMLLTAMQVRDAAFVQKLTDRMMQGWLRIHLEDFQRHTAKNSID